MASGRRHLATGDEDGRQLPSLLLFADLDAALEAAIRSVLELHSCLVGLVKPRHEHIVQATKLVGPARELRSDVVVASLQRPACAVVVLWHTRRHVRYHEHLVGLLLGPEAHAQAPHKDKALGLQTREARLVRDIDGVAHLTVHSHQISSGRIPLVVLPRVLSGRLFSAVLLLSRHLLWLQLHGLSHAAAAAVGPRGASATTGQACSLDLAPHVALAGHAL
mmetsp:Transcript_34389/g.87497  ORF Transcript_34389/g.87497 Transcript_34389/m.87497 type:complete len:221 (-) Transcript_34389:214-876(-)